MADLWRRSVREVLLYSYVKRSFLKHNLWTWHCKPISGMALIAFGKELFISSIYSETSLNNHHHRSTTPLYRSLYFGPRQSSMQIFYLPNPTISLNGPLKVGPMVGRFREVLMYSQDVEPQQANYYVSNKSLYTSRSRLYM